MYKFSDVVLRLQHVFSSQWTLRGAQWSLSWMAGPVPGAAGGGGVSRPAPASAKGANHASSSPEVMSAAQERTARQVRLCPGRFTHIGAHWVLICVLAPARSPRGLASGRPGSPWLSLSSPSSPQRRGAGPSGVTPACCSGLEAQVTVLCVVISPALPREQRTPEASFDRSG